MNILSDCNTGGCGAKIGPGELGDVLRALPAYHDPNLLVGFDAFDDAAVYRIGPDAAVVSTVDFFPPMVDDAHLFGKIAAANALSDIYAMGARPLFALNLLCFPEKGDKTDLAAILRGGADKLAEAGIPLAGGHSIHDREIKFGLSVSGLVDPGKILRNTGCRPGDRLVLTKALGTGIVLAANRVGEADPQNLLAAAASMERLNKYAAEAVSAFRPSACTDVTGFGLLVHLAEMTGGQTSMEVWPEALPILSGAYDYAAEYLLTAAGQRNRRFMEGRIEPRAFSAVPAPMQEIMLDPQTSGGLLFSVPERESDAFLAAVRETEPAAAVVGAVATKKEWPIFFGHP